MSRRDLLLNEGLIALLDTNCGGSVRPRGEAMIDARREEGTMKGVEREDAANL
jgi:hypothetical protein